MRNTESELRKSSRHFDWGAWLFKIAVFFVLVIILAPIVIVVYSSFSGKTHMSWPFTDLTFRWYREVLERPIWVKAFVNSLIIGLLTSAISLAISTPAAFAVSRRKSKAATFIRSFISWPLLVPPVIIGISLLMMLSRAGLRGTHLAIAIGHTLWAAPLVFITMNAVFERFNPIYVAAARDLGANSLQAFFKVTLPIVKSGLISAMFLGFVVSTQEFIIALFLYAPSTITLPVEIYTAIRYELSPGISAISVYMIGIVGAALFVIDRVIGIERIGFTGKG